MRDLDIRQALDRQLRAEHPDGDTQIFHEFGVAHGAARVDIGLINGRIEGFEIKSDRDTLRRLPAQMEAYNRVFDRVTIVAGEGHLDRLLQTAPEWWGVARASEASGGVVSIDLHRVPRDNPSREPIALCELLWRNELVGVLERFGLAKGCKSKPKRVLQLRLAEGLSIDELSREIRNALKLRDWRADSRLV